MGVYYNISNQTKKQKLEPSKIGGGSIKASMIFNCGTLLAYLMMTCWRNDLITINGDSTDFYFEVQDTYEDITEEAIKTFNERWQDCQIPGSIITYDPR